MNGTSTENKIESSAFYPVLPTNCNKKPWTNLRKELSEDSESCKEKQEVWLGNQW